MLDALIYNDESWVYLPVYNFNIRIIGPKRLLQGGDSTFLRLCMARLTQESGTSCSNSPIIRQ